MLTRVLEMCIHQIICQFQIKAMRLLCMILFRDVLSLQISIILHCEYILNAGLAAHYAFIDNSSTEGAEHKVTTL